MTKTQWRDEFIATMGAAGVRVASARALLVLARRAQRLAEARCNGDWPADNGVRETKVCPVCECGWASTFRRNREDPKGPRICPDCRCEQDIHALVAAEWPNGWDVVTAGDPRGAVVALVRPGAVETEGGYYQHGDLVAVPS